MKFSELPEDVQYDVLEEHRTYNVYDDWWEFLVEGFQEKMARCGITFSHKHLSFDLYRGEIGLNKIEVEDYEKFANYIIKELELPETFRKYFYEDYFEIDIRYPLFNMHWGEPVIYLDVLLENALEDCPKRKKEIKELCKALEGWTDNGLLTDFIDLTWIVQDELLKPMLKDLQESYWELTSDECITRTFEELNFEFDEYGDVLSSG